MHHVILLPDGRILAKYQYQRLGALGARRSAFSEFFFSTAYKARREKRVKLVIVGEVLVLVYLVAYQRELVSFSFLFGGLTVNEVSKMLNVLEGNATCLGA